VDHRTVVEAVDYDKAREVIASFVREYVAGAGSRGVVVGLSGGVDSTVAAALAVEALGRGRVLGCLCPLYIRPPRMSGMPTRLLGGLGLRFCGWT